ncbi:MAG: RtcB family protein [Clostridiales bacterium]|nr:RtcB family protein [Clostridiales bacterium]
MILIEGKFNTAKVFTDVIEDGAIEQIRDLCDQEFTKGSKIRIMPDVHEGAGCTIGTTMTISDKVVPNLVGVDIGCGMEVIQIGNPTIDLNKLDRLIYARIPSGFSIRKKPHRYNDEINLLDLRCYKKADLSLDRAILSLGTLGGGNHFIEANTDEQGNIYIVVHSGSRNLGLQVAQYYQKKAYESIDIDIPRDLAYLSGELMEDYIHDMKIIQRFAVLNRKAIMDEIINGLKLEVVEDFTTIHNYIDTDKMILRKGAVSALKDEKFLLPMNMRDGSLICLGKGNPDWNYSAPHGAGRLMSRNVARAKLSLDDFKKEMEGIYTTSVNKKTLDEAPMAYKDMDDIVRHIGDTAKVIKVIKPIYNFKAN